jgi:hypothetical protein
LGSDDDGYNAEMITAAQQSIARQRDALSIFLKEPLAGLASNCAQLWTSIEGLEDALRAGLALIPYCDHVYATDLDGIQITALISVRGDDRQNIGLDRSLRPYMSTVIPMSDFILSEAYISEYKKRPSITAVQLVKRDGIPVGLLGATFDLRDLPLTAPLYEESTSWRQMKGDPSIRGGLFLQQRFESVLDQHIETVIAVIEELIIDHGVFHCEIHFSSNRATVWSQADPYRYHILTIDELVDPDVCLAFQKYGYPDSAAIPSANIRPLLESFRDLRFADETIYLRLATLNIFNGLVGLTFSCDGSHSIFADEFLHKGLAFWIGSAAAGSTTIPGVSVNPHATS